MDPRRDKRASYCDKLPEDKLKTGMHAALFSYSTFIDAGLYRFKNPNTGRYLTTSQLFIDDNSYPASYHPAVPGLADAKDYQLDTGTPSTPLNPFEGPVLSASLPEELLKQLPATSRLLRYKNAAGSFITLVEGVKPPRGYGVPDSSSGEANDVEGYVYGQNLGNSSPLQLWKKNLADGYLTTTLTTTTGAPAGFSKMTPMGYLPFLKDYAAAAP